MKEKEELFRQACALNVNNKYKQVIALLQTNILKEAGSAELYTERAKAYYFLNEYDSLLEDSSKAIKINANYYKAYIYYGNYYLHKKPAKAVEAYTVAIKIYEACDDAYNNRGTAYAMLGKFDLAMRDFIKAIELNNISINSYNNLSCLLYNQNEYNKALEHINTAIKLSGPDASLYYNRALLYACKKEYSKSIADFDKAIELNPPNLSACLERACALLNNNQFDEAIDGLNKVVLSDPQFGRGMPYFKKGQAWLSKKDFIKAVADFTQAINIGKHLFEAFGSRALAFYNLGQLDAAMADCDAALKIEPHCTTAHYCRGLILNDRGEFTKAIAYFNNAIEWDDKFSSAYLGRGLILFKQKQYEKAIYNFDACLNIEGGDTQALYNRGRSYFLLSEANKAFADFNKAVELNPGFAEALYARGILWAQKNDFEQAIVDFTNAININGSLAEAYHSRGILLACKTQVTKALEDFIIAAKITPYDAEIYLSAGLAHHNKNEYDTAIEFYDKAIALDGKLANAYARRGNVWYDKNEYYRAIADYQKAMALDKDFEYLVYNIDLSKSKIGEPISMTGKSSGALFYFMEALIGGLPIEHQAEIKKAALKVLNSIDKLKEYAANIPNLQAVYYLTNLKAADSLIMNKAARVHFFNAVMQKPDRENVLQYLLNSEDNITSVFDYTLSRGLASDNMYVGSFFPAAIPENNPAMHTTQSPAGNVLVKFTTLDEAHNQNEVRECSMVIKTSFFATIENDACVVPGTFRLQNKMNKKNTLGQSLYKVLYYNKTDGSIKGDKKGDAKAYLSQFKGGLQQLLENKLVSELTSHVVDKLVNRFVSEIQYLFKSTQYAQDNELRVIEYVPADDERIKTEQKDTLPRGIYIESYKELQPHLHRIELTPRIDNPERWMYLEVEMHKNGYKQFSMGRHPVPAQKQNQELVV